MHPDEEKKSPNTAARPRPRWLGKGILLGVVLASVGGIVVVDYLSCAPADALGQATYVGRQSCAQCHQPQVTAHFGSHHDLAMDRATEGSVLGDFSGIELEHHGIVSRMFREDDRYMIHTEGPDGTMADFEIKFVFGVDPLQQYMVELDRAPDAAENEVGRVQVLRVSWDTNREKWFYLNPPQEDEKLEPDDPYHWTGRTQNWNHTCAECHSTNLVKNFSIRDLHYRTTFDEIDVSCEACHGPGSLHIELAEAKSMFWDRRHGYGLANLKSEDPEIEIQTCAKCHSRRGGVHSGFRPGENYYDFYSTTLLSESIYHPDGQILDEDYVHGSFLQSRMHQKGVRCSDCHDPHTARLKYEGNQVCTSCHQHEAAKYDSPNHHHHMAGSAGASCVECHMPETTYMSIDPRRDHSLGVPRPDLSVDLGTPNACSRCHLNLSRIPLEKQESLHQYADWLRVREAGDEEIGAELARLDAWSLEHFTEWYGEKEDRGEHFAYALAAGWEVDPEAADDLARVARNRRLPAIVRASAITALSRYPSKMDRLGFVPSTLPEDDPLQIMLQSLDDGNPLVRSAALSSLQGFPPAALQKHVVPLLDDRVRLVRFEAARLLARLSRIDLGREAIDKRDAILRERIEYLRENGDQANVLLSLGQLYEQSGELDAAQAAYRNAIRVQPGVTGPRTNLAALLDEQSNVVMQRGEREQAFAMKEEVVQLRAEELPLLARDAEMTPNIAVGQYRFGLALYLAGEKEQAEVQLLRAVELEPNNIEYLLGLVFFYQRYARWTDGLPWAERLYQLAPENVDATQLLLQFQQQTTPDPSR